MQIKLNASPTIIADQLENAPDMTSDLAWPLLVKFVGIEKATEIAGLRGFFADGARIADARKNATITVSRRQAREALIRSGVPLDSVTKVIEAIEDETERAIALNYWESANDFISGHPIVKQIGAALNLDVLRLFKLAETL
jgi:hypothetical protein